MTDQPPAELTPDQVVGEMPNYFLADKAGSTSASILFDLSGQHAGKRFITIADGKATSGQGEVENPNLTFIVDSVDFVKIFTGGLDGIGERIIRTLVENLDKSDRGSLVTLTRSAPTHDRSETLLREFIDREITGRLAAMLDTPDAALRASMVNVQMLGLVVARYIMRIEPIASAPVDELVSRFGPLVQHCLTG